MELRKPLGRTINSRLKRARSVQTDFFKDNPAASVIATKLIPDRQRPKSIISDNGVTITDESAFNEMIQKRARRNLDADTILSLNPDIKLIRETLVSCIRSPLSMEDDQLFFKVGDSDLPMSLLNGMIEPIESHFTTEHNLSDELSDMIADALVNRGSSSWAFIPEASLDDLINKSSRISNESFIHSVESQFFDTKAGILKGRGILGDATMPSRNAAIPTLESYGFIDTDVNQKIADNLFITDNPAQLRLPILNAAFNQAKMRTVARGNSFGRIPRVSNESNNMQNRTLITDKNNDRIALARNIERIQNSLYNPRSSHRTGNMRYNGTQVVASAHEASRSSIGHPMVLPLLNESTIPIFVPGNEKRHIGYFIITDGYGQPLNVTQELKRFQQQGFGNLNAANSLDMTSTMLQQINVMQNGFCVGRDTTMSERLRMFSDILETNLMNRVKNGLRGMSVKMKYDEDMMRLMFMRLLSNEMTHIVFLSAEQVAYLAYEYDENGVGVSMLDGVKQIATLRTMANFANFMASVRNAVGRTKVTLNIDERDPDPEKSSAILQDEFLRSQAGITPTDVSTSSEMFRVIRQMGITFDVQGNTRIPNTSVNVEDFQSQKQMIDNDFMDRLEKQVYMGFYVTPEMVDATQGSDFAITRWTSNQLFAKRIKNLQKITETFLKKYVSIYTFSDGSLIHDLQTIIEDNKGSLPASYLERQGNGEVLYQSVIEEFIRILEIKLPSPDNTKLDVQMDQLNKYVQGLDVAINAWVSADFAEIGLGDNDRDALAPLIASIKAYYIREYMLKNNIFTELSELTRQGSEDNPALDVSKEVMLHINNLTTNLGDWASAVKLRREKYLELLEQRNSEYANAITGNDGGGTSTDDSSASSTDDDNTPPGDEGDFSFDFPDTNPPSDEAPPAENAGADDNNPGGEGEMPEAGDNADTPPADNAGNQPSAPSEPTP